MSAELTARQQREVAYHRDYAQRKADKAAEPVTLDVVMSGGRRWWNAYWHTYGLLQRHDLRGKTVLVPGCGFGEDAIRIASLGAAVRAFDLSPEIVAVTRARAHQLGYHNLRVDVMPCEDLAYPADSFDFVFLMDILHHVDVAAACAEIRRVARPGAVMIGDELYTSRFLQRSVRQSYLVNKVVYPRMVRYVYGRTDPYITDDERKIDERDLAHVVALCPGLDCAWFNTVVGRLVPDRSDRIARLDRALTRSFGRLGRLFAGRVVFEGRVAKG
ncbi:MAG: class I SAM-dependent methyltransferase [Rhodospirillales bacterium]